MPTVARFDGRRLAALLSGLWAGAIAALAGIGAPAAFAVLEREVAGRVAGRMFAHEAYLALGLSVVLLVLARRVARVESEGGRGTVFSTDVVLVLGALFCTLFGYFALQPMMVAARAGQGGLWSFGALHGLSAALFGIKGLIAAALAWRLSRAPTT